MKKSIKDAAKRGDTQTCKMLAREVVRSRKAVNRMHTSKAQITLQWQDILQKLDPDDQALLVDSIAGPPLAGWMYDETGSYTSSTIFSCAFFLLSTLWLSRLGERAWSGDK